MEREQKILVNELTQGKELAEQLRNHLNNISSFEMRQGLVEQILSSYEKALSMLNWDASAIETKPIITTLESPHSNYAKRSPSPRSEVSDQDCKDQCHGGVYKKRKTQPRWTLRVCSESGMEGPPDDGYNWRKYGQKDILGANFPRSYYRCTHRHSQGCLATKQVQRSDQDPTIFEVNYSGKHKCLHSSRLATSSPSPINDKSEQNKDNFQLQQLEDKPKPLNELSFNYKDGLKSEDLDIFPSFSFPDASYMGNENDIYRESLIENNLLGSLSSPAFISPATSESNYFSVSPCHYSVRTPESDSLPTSVVNSPIGIWDISIDNVEFDASFPFEL
ncbi:probable WRKY transcription factor 53 [Ricinus communis]|uniref:WRKY transcription factor, putative n=1 Tax=Ricinus communis TaxID=3988 RepID=B9RDW9_RICCO|nr:probable WRKY transcription factor 53 [Ricinus communis]XP_048226424.1 probable WRKY transcription factor 53 [Ricinus communis]EEF50577.1 WRKY transcription factor, putative [Ricinus communis]|eukprot:XP_002511908.1 probable WRKY transcription factor 53 [Ricinus communis]